ncbi:MAG: hypothetical protein Kow0090_00150 [Myxococcota bacterium]
MQTEKKNKQKKVYIPPKINSVEMVKFAQLACGYISPTQDIGPPVCQLAST